MAQDPLLTALSTAESVTTTELARQLGVEHQAVVGMLKSLECEGYVVSEKVEFPTWKLSDEAKLILANGSPEFRLWSALASGPMEQGALAQLLGEEDLKNGMKNAMAQRLLETNKVDGKVVVARKQGAVLEKDTCRAALEAAAANATLDAAAADVLKKRKLATLESIKAFVVKKGPKYALVRRGKAKTDLTKEMLADKSWASSDYKAYNIDALGVEPQGGQLHPLLKVRQEFREIFLELGFQEMDTQRFVDSSFWNFDALFVPQKHPARDSQDTFFVSKPEFAAQPPASEYLETVRRTHEEGYKCEWSEKETARNVLRTHTTGTSAYVLNELLRRSPPDASGKRTFQPGRYFSIDRVFRNEQMDRTHLCEFHQIEGVVIDRNLSLSNLIHILGTFFSRIGIDQLRFKPAYNPYTEPSMEIFGFHKGMNRWMEVGNSGIFRPEMLKPMGYDEDVSVLGWGLSLERPTMIKYGIDDIHKLFGHKVDLKFIRRAMIARY